MAVCDACNVETLNSARQWKQNLDENAQLPDKSPLPIVLLANKYDLIEEGKCEEGEEVTEQQLEDFAAENHFTRFFYTSAKTGHNINDAFQYLVEEVMRHDLNSMRTQSKDFESVWDQEHKNRAESGKINSNRISGIEMLEKERERNIQEVIKLQQKEGSGKKGQNKECCAG